MRDVAHRYRLTYWDTVGEKDQAVPGVLAQGWIRQWLADPAHRDEVMEVCDWLGLWGRQSNGWYDERDLGTYVRPALLRAIETGELVVVERNPLGRWKPMVVEVPRETVAPRPPEKAKTSKTWIEFEVLDEEKKPIADERWEARLPDGSAKKGKTDSKGIARIEEIDPGVVEFTLPDRDAESWGPSPKPPEKSDFLDFALFDENEDPLADQKWEARLPGGKSQSGKTDAQGRVRIDKLAQGEAEVSFPEFAKT